MKINTIAKETGFSKSTIRYYEQQGLIRNIKRDNQGVRVFSEDDLIWVKFLTTLKGACLSHNEMMYYAELYYSKNENMRDRLAVTESCKERLLSQLSKLQKGIEFLDYKIEYYNKKIKKAESNSNQ